eukprot:5139414-Alexandrium_andersonii.AAC.1
MPCRSPPHLPAALAAGLRSPSRTHRSWRLRGTVGALLGALVGGDVIQGSGVAPCQPKANGCPHMGGGLSC